MLFSASFCRSSPVRIISLFINFHWDALDYTKSCHSKQPSRQRFFHYVESLNHSHAISPRWIVTDWSPCSKTCGTGVQTREMKCHEKTSSHHYSEISTSKCDPSKLPDVSQLSRKCNQIICKPDWKIESTWTAVSDYLNDLFLWRYFEEQKSCTSGLRADSGWEGLGSLLALIGSLCWDCGLILTSLSPATTTLQEELTSS